MLSVGYAACHWCHVMAHESFEDNDTALLMNQHFINIKVDREERPDIDRIYQTAHYVFARRPGGWPLTMFLTPSGEPFFGGTYFPKVGRDGLLSFTFILQKVTETWRDKRADIIRQNTEVLNILSNLDKHTRSEETLNEKPILQATMALNDMTDRNLGGFKGAPKFPHPVETFFILAEGARAQNKNLLAGVCQTLEKMAAGGIYDHIGGGFFRYSVDERWTIPHFEKMLYDNALLMATYADAECAFRDCGFADVAIGIAAWAKQEMANGGGGFYSSLDADSEGGEGAFYVWEEKQLREALPDKDDYAVLDSHFGLSAGPNFEGRLWHLTRRQKIAQTAAAMQISPADCAGRLTNAKQTLFSKRAERPRPATDDKTLAAWNGLMIKGLSRTGRLLARPDFLTAAKDALSFVRDNMLAGGRLKAVWRKGQNGQAGFLDDYAFLLDGTLELLRAEFSAETLDFAQQLAAELCINFEDEKHGGFFFTANDGEKLIRRPKAVDDNAIPSGNGLAVQSLLRLSWLVGDRRWAKKAESALRCFYDSMQKQPAGSTSLLLALRDYLSPPQLVFLAGDKTQCHNWQRQLEDVFNPALLVYILPQQRIGLPAAADKPAPASGVLAYVCEARTCREPTANLKDLMNQLSRLSSDSRKPNSRHCS